MRRVVALLLVGFLSLSSPGDEPTKPMTFAKADLDKLPAGWASDQTGEGEGSVWKVKADPSAPSKSGFALAQLAEGPKPLFNLCVRKDSLLKDGEVSVSIKSIAGKIDQGGGVVWRYIDARNYYTCRFNPLESNFRLYFVKDGVRKQLATADADSKEGEWFTVAVKQTGAKIECSLNGKRLLEATDETFKDAGKVGLWTKADAVSHFDQFRYTPEAKGK